MGLNRWYSELDPVMWTPGDWDRLALVPMTNTGTNSYDRTTPTYGADGIRRGRVTHTAGAEGSDRRAYVLADHTVDDRLLTVWNDATLWAAGGYQIGQAHRIRQNDPDGLARGWFVNNDFVFAQTALLNMTIFTWDPAGTGAALGQTSIASGTLTGIQKIITAADASRTGGTVTATGLPATHGIAVGDTVTVNFADNSYDGTFVITSAPAGGTTVQWAQAVADDPSAGAGTINNLDGVLPLAVESELIGSTLRARAWRLADQHRPSWSDPTHALQGTDTGVGDPYPARRGRSGLYHGHVDTGGFVEWDALARTRIH